MKDKEICPVCNSTDVRDDYDSPDTMSACDGCLSEWVRDGQEITLDARDYFTDEELKSKDWNPKE